MMDILFYIAASVALISAMLAIIGFNIAHSLLYVVIMMIAISMIYLLLGAPFPAALQIIVYAGAIIVLFIFVIMMLHQGPKSQEQERRLFTLAQAILPFLLTAILAGELIYLLSPFSTVSLEAVSTNPITPRDIGLKLYGPYVLLVEIAALLLTSAVVGAFHIGRRHQRGAV